MTFLRFRAVKSFSEIKKGGARYKSPYVQVGVDVSQIFQYVTEWYNTFVFYNTGEKNNFEAIYVYEKTRVYKI